MSRLCRDNMIDGPTECTEEQILSALFISNKPIKIQYSKISKLRNSKVGHFGLERTLRRFMGLRCLAVSTSACQTLH